MRHVPLALTATPILLASLAAPGHVLAQTNWQKLSPALSPAARNYHAMVYDQARARAVLFGGTTNTFPSFQNDTWEWVGATWVQRLPQTQPPARGQHAMAYDAARRRTVLFGGYVVTFGGNMPTITTLGDTWEWDGTNWTKRTPAGSPPARSNHGMAYDAARKRVVLFGGSGTAGSLGDTWEWDGTRWQQRFPSNSPSPRIFFDMTYDAARKRVVLFGGSPSNETWLWDGNNWTRPSLTTAPSTRAATALAYDSKRQRVVLFGGNQVKNGPRRYLSDTWEWDGSGWTQMQPRTSAPPAEEHKMCYFAARGQVLLFGGREPTGGWRRAETWVYAPTPQPLAGTPPTISVASGGTHSFALDAGTTNASRLYWIFGSVTGTSPGVTLASPAGSVTIPLLPDPWTDITIALANTPLLTRTRGTLDGAGKATAAFNVPKITNPSAIGVKFQHAYLVYDAQNNFYKASNPVSLTLVK